MQIEQFIVLYLMYFVVPLWLLAGLADWVCHWQADMEHSSGPQESMLHLVMLVEMGIPSVAVLFLEVNALILLVALIGFLLHEATAMWDVSYASSRRHISPFEQHVHSFLELIPLMALSCLAFLHRDQIVAVFDDEIAADWTLEMKSEPLPAPYLASVIIAFAVLQVGPYLQELWRALRARKLEEARARQPDAEATPGRLREGKT